MEKSDIAIHVDECGKKAQYHADGNRAGYHPDIVPQWMQAKMLAEIAYQLAVMNERNALEDERLVDRVEGQSLIITALENRLDKLEPKVIPGSCMASSPSRPNFYCGLPMGHGGPHGDCR